MTSYNEYRYMWACPEKLQERLAQGFKPADGERERNRLVPADYVLLKYKYAELTQLQT